MRLYFDANAFIAAIEGVPAPPQLQALLDGADRRLVTIVTSELSIAETLTGPIKALRVADDKSAADLYVAYSNLFSEASRIETRPIDKWVLLQAAELRAHAAALKLPDAIHLATATTFGCDELVTGDKALRRVAQDLMRGCSLDPADLDALLARIETAS